MKIRHITTAIVFASVTALAGPASAITSTGNLLQDVHSALTGEGNITAKVSGNTVTLIGNASALDKVNAERVAASYPNVDRVINLISDRS
jgi:osmotically-inducible protein OsmY